MRMPRRRRKVGALEKGSPRKGGLLQHMAASKRCAWPGGNVAHQGVAARSLALGAANLKAYLLCYLNCKGAVAGLGADRRDAVERLAHDADLADGVGPLDAAERAPRRAVRAHRQADARRGGVAVGLHGGKAANLELRADGGGVLRADGRVDGVHALLDLFHKGSGGWRAC